MKKILFKNDIANIIIGVLVLGATAAGYFLEWFDDFMAIIIGVVIIVLSVKRFAEAIKLNNIKEAKMLLVLEIVLDLAFGGLLVYYKNNIQLYVGLTVYLRGVIFLFISFLSSKKRKFYIYFINIAIVTLGSYLMFTSTSYAEYLELLLVAILAIVGLVYLLFGIKGYMAYKKANPKAKKTVKAVEKKPVKVEDKKEIKAVEKTTATEIKVKENKVNTLENKVAVDYENLTIPVLKVIAKDKGITGISGITKAELIKKLKDN